MNKVNCNVNNGVDKKELNDMLHYSVENVRGDIDDFVFMGQDSFISDR